MHTCLQWISVYRLFGLQTGTMTRWAVWLNEGEAPWSHIYSSRQIDHRKFWIVGMIKKMGRAKFYYSAIEQKQPQTDW